MMSNPAWIFFFIPIVTLVTFHIVNFVRVIILGRGTIDDMPNKSNRKVEKSRSELDKYAHTLPGVNDTIFCPEWKPKPDGSYTHDEWELFCRGGQRDLFRVIMHLNDHHRWSREKIADFVQAQHDSGKINVAFEQDLFANRKDTQ